MINRHVLEFIPPEYHPQVIETIRRRDAGQEMDYYDIDISAKGGNRRIMRVSGNPITFNGEPATLIVLFDITERKRAEQALQQANRKIALLNSVTRHDISNHLLVLTGLLELLQDTTEPSERAVLLEKVRRAAARISAAIQFTRDYEKIGGSDPQWQDIHDLVETAKADFVSPVLTIENQLPRGLLVFSDSMMEKVITNLIDNSVRHGGNVTSVRFSTAEDKENLLIAYEDDGTGIPEGEKEMIFERGYGRNTGWGLFLSREILAITGMSIREDGVPGKGARFLLTVPRGTWKNVTWSADKKGP